MSQSSLLHLLHPPLEGNHPHAAGRRSIRTADPVICAGKQVSVCKEGDSPQLSMGTCFEQSGSHGWIRWGCTIMVPMRRIFPSPATKDKWTNRAINIKQGKLTDLGNLEKHNIQRSVEVSAMLFSNATVTNIWCNLYENDIAVASKRASGAFEACPGCVPGHRDQGSA